MDVEKAADRGEILDTRHPLVDIIANVDWNGKLGCAKVYDSGVDAGAMFPRHPAGSKIICYGGFYNAVWVPYHHDSQW